MWPSNFLSRGTSLLIVNDRDKLDWHAGMTVQDLLDAFGYNYVLITITVNGSLVPREEWKQIFTDTFTLES